MSVQVTTNGGGRLRYPDLNLKPNLTSTGVGMWLAFAVTLPTTMTGNGMYPLVANDENEGGSFGTIADQAVRFRGSGMSNPNRLEHFSSFTNQLWPTGEEIWTAQTPFVPGASYLVIVGVRQIAGQWKAFRAYARVGTPAEAEVQVSTGNVNSTWLTTTGDLVRDLFWNLGTATFQTRAGLALEHVGQIRGDFPLDGSDLPDIAIVRGLVQGTYKYDSGAVLNGGSILDWRKLSGSADLGDYGPLSNAALTLASGSVSDSAAILPWADFAINERPSGWIFGGNGLVAPSFSGILPAGITALDYRFVRHDTGVVIAGQDWRAVSATIGSGQWSFTCLDSPPAGATPLRLQVRDRANPGTIVSTGSVFYVGMRMLKIGQSQCTRLRTMARTIEPTAGLVGAVLAPTPKTAASGGVYAQPQREYVVMAVGGAGSVGDGDVELMNQWWADTGGIPLMIIENSDQGIGSDAWAANATNDGYFWPCLGDYNSLPGVSNANGSGISTALAIWSERQVDFGMFWWGTNMVQRDLSYMQTNLADLFSKLDLCWTASAGFPVVIMDHPRSLDGTDIPEEQAGESANNWAYQKTMATIGQSGGRYRWGGSIRDFLVGDGGNFAHQVSDLPGGNRRGGRKAGRIVAGAIVNPQTIKRFGPIAARAYFTNGTRNVIEVETGETLTTANGAAVNPDFIWISTDSGATWSNTGFTPTISGTKLVITKSSGSWPAGTTRFEYLRGYPYDQSTGGPFFGVANSVIETEFDGLVYGAGTFVPGTSGGRGLHMMPVYDPGLSVEAAAGAGPRLAINHKLPPGTYPITVRMTHDGGTVDKVVNVTVT